MSSHRAFELPSALDWSDWSVRILATAESFHETTRKFRSLRAGRRRCRIDVERADASLDVYVELEPLASWTERLDLEEWQALAAELGQQEHFDAPYLLYKLTNAVTRTLAPDRSVPTGEVFPPRVYKPDGPWHRYRSKHLHDYSVRARLTLDGVANVGFTTSMSKFIDSLWFLRVENVYTSLRGDATLAGRRGSTVQLRLAYDAEKLNS